MYTEGKRAFAKIGLSGKYIRACSIWWDAMVLVLPPLCNLQRSRTARCITQIAVPMSPPFRTFYKEILNSNASAWT